MKVINFQVSDELHKSIKLEATRQGKSLKVYRTDLKSKKEQTR